MKLIKKELNINFVKYMLPYSIISGLFIGITLFLIFTKGIKYGLDFKGGIEIQVQFTSPIDLDATRSLFGNTDLGSPSIQSYGDIDNHEFLLKFNLQDEDYNMVRDKVDHLLKMIPNTSYEIRRLDVVGPKIGKELRDNGLWAMLISLVLIFIYVAFRFDSKFAPGAVIALFHDVLVIIGFFVIMNKEFDTSTIAALLTIIGYSLNDTIVIYDRIRENLTLMKGRLLKDIVNKSVNETLSRTFLTALTTLFVVLSLLIWGGPVLYDFSLAMAIGVVCGTYSTVFIASPFILVIDKYSKRPYTISHQDKGETPKLAA